MSLEHHHMESSHSPAASATHY